MGFFGKRKVENKEAPRCAAPVSDTAERAGGGAAVKVLGPGCAKCHALTAAAKEALAELGMDGAVEHVSGLAGIAAYGVMSTPALVVGGRVVSSGRVLKKEEIAKLLREARG